MDRRPVIVVVSGLPRSGTSMMMQMLAAGGMRVFTDGTRTPDAGNPLGYYELEKVKRLGADVSWIGQAEGKAIKIISPLLVHLPTAYRFQVLFMERPLAEILASQDVMLKRNANSRANRPTQTAMRAYFEDHLTRTKAWLSTVDHMAVRYQSYHDVLANPARRAEEVVAFLGLPLDIDAMAGAVRQELYRQRLSREARAGVDAIS
jgi:hypothetical protein